MLTLLLSILTSRLTWGFIGATAIAAVIWLMGSLLSIGYNRPLEPEPHRILAIVAVYLIWILSFAIPRLRNARLNRKMMDQLQQDTLSQQNHNQKHSRTNEEQLLADRFVEAMNILKKAHFNKAGGGPSWWTCFAGGNYLYQLPWYVVIGAPGAGKTTALVNSGLQFPLADRFGKTALRGIGGTRNCDWWFTNEAVLLDTAGRYTSQESEQTQDASGWLTFIALLRKYRRRQPLNGVVVTVSVSDLLTQSAEASHQHAINLRQRLMELNEQLGIRFPVYVLVTKVDLLKGFRAWFLDYDKAQRDQIWGFTFPWEETTQADFDLMGRFDQEFSLLQQRIERGLPDTMLQEHDARMRADVWFFPQEFAALHPLLADFLSTVFSHSNFETQFLPRGFYFASGTQEGAPFDHVMGELTRSLSLPVANGSDRWDRVSKTAPVPGSRGQSYFIKNLLQNVIFQEAGLAGHNRWWEIRSRVMIWSGYVVLVALLVVLSGLWLISYSNNETYLKDVQNKVTQIDQQTKALQKSEHRELLTMIPLLNDLQALPKSEVFDVNDPPLTRRMGLYRGYEVRNASENLYQKALQRMLLPEISMHITNWVRHDNGSDVEYSYEALKAYLMLYQPRQYDGEFLLSWVMLNLRRQLPKTIPESQFGQLEGHLIQLLKLRVQSSPFAKDGALIAHKRALINHHPLPNRIYGRLKRLLEHHENLKPISLATLGGPQSELVFSRKSGKPISEGVPGLYTPDGYWKVFDQQIDDITNALYDDDSWVLGTRIVADDKQQIDDAVRELYVRDFISLWDHYLADIRLNNSADLSSRINAVRLLSTSNSPLRQLVINLSKVLSFSRGDLGEAIAEKGQELSNSATHTLDELFNTNDINTVQNTSTPRGPEQRVTEHYAAFIELAQPLGKDSKSIVFDDFVQQLDELYRYLTAVQDAANSGMPPPSGDVIDRLQASAGRLPGGLQSMFSKIAVGANSDTQRRELDNVRKKINVELGSFCHQAITGRYPLERSSITEITPDDLARMFAPGTGMMDTFFRENLSNKVDTGQKNWRFLPGIDGKTRSGGEKTLRPFQQAQLIRDAFFANGATTPSFKVTVRTHSMDKQILNMTLDVDGQQLRYSHGPQVVQMMNWPGQGGTNQVRLQLGLINGTTSTLETSGPWALNRFFDKAKVSPGNHNLSRQATFSINGRQVVLEFVPHSIRNPFLLPHFSCP